MGKKTSEQKNLRKGQGTVGPRISKGGAWKVGEMGAVGPAAGAM